MTSAKDALPAGRELDALIAEKVMGDSGVLVCGNRGPLYGERTTTDCDQILGRWFFEGVCPKCRWHGRTMRILRHYSTDIADAWKIVEHGFVWPGHAGKPMLHLLRACANGQWEIQWCSDFGYSKTTKADTAPLAICRAALRVIAS